MAECNEEGHTEAEEGGDKKIVCGWRQNVADIDSKTERTTSKLKGLPRFDFLRGIKAILCAIQLRYFVRQKWTHILGDYS